MEMDERGGDKDSFGGTPQESSEPALLYGSYQDALGYLAGNVLRAKEWESSERRTQSMSQINRELAALAKSLEDASSALAVLRLSDRSLAAVLHEYAGSGPPRHSFNSAAECLADLTSAARAAVENRPDARFKLALRVAAFGLVRIRHYYGYDRPKLYSDGPVVLELEEICSVSGLAYAPETLRNALAEAWRVFDPANPDEAWRQLGRHQWGISAFKST